MTTYTTFAQLKNLDQSASLILNVVAGTWVETETRRGAQRRSFAGNMLSTERTPKRTWTATVEFMSGALLDSFLLFISNSIDVTTSQPLTYRTLRLMALGSNSALHITSASSSVPVMVRADKRTSFEHTVANVNTVGWSVEIVIEEV